MFYPKSLLILLQSEIYFLFLYYIGSSQLPLVNEDNENNYNLYKTSNMKIHVPSTLPKGVRTTNKQTQQRNSHNVSVDYLYI